MVYLWSILSFALLTIVLSALLMIAEKLLVDYGICKLDINAGEKPLEVDGGQKASVGMPPRVIEGFKKMIPLGRAGTPEEAADAVYLLCSPESNYISGQTLICGGGLSM